MTRKHDFHSVEFFRKIRDEHAALISDWPQEEIIAFFSSHVAADKVFQRVGEPGDPPIASPGLSAAEPASCKYHKPKT